MDPATRGPGVLFRRRGKGPPLHGRTKEYWEGGAGTVRAREGGFSICHLTFFICHCEESRTQNGKWQIENDKWKMTFSTVRLIDAGREKTRSASSRSDPIPTH